MAISRRAGLRGVFPVGAQGRFLVGVRGTGVDARDPPPLLDDDGDGGRNAKKATLSSDVCGDYLAEYGTHGKELVTVSRKGERLVGTKVSGDDHVPAGEVSFELDANEGGATSSGRIRVAGPQFSDPTWRDVDAVAVSRDEFALESRTEPVALVLRRAEPDATSAVFLDAFGGGRMLTRHQLLRRTRKLDDDDDDDDTQKTRGDDAAPDVADDERLDAAPFPAAPPLEIARRMCRNLHAAAQRRNDRLDAMIWSHAELDFRAPNADQDAAR